MASPVRWCLSFLYWIVDTMEIWALRKYEAIVYFLKKDRIKMIIRMNLRIVHYSILSILQNHLENM